MLLRFYRNKNIKDIEDMVLFGIYIGFPIDISGNIYEQYVLFSDRDETRFIWMIYFLSTIALPVRGRSRNALYLKELKNIKNLKT